MQANSNRLSEETVRDVLFVFNANGSRQSAAQGLNFEELCWYDGLGRTSGVAATGPTAQLGPNQCRYDPDGQMYNTCDEAAPFLAFDGNNVVMAFEDEWRFVHGHGVDDPIIGLLRPATGTRRLLYIITDGNGRQLMVTDSSGQLTSEDVIGSGNLRSNWTYAGATSSANTFNSDRQNPPNLPTVALFRNRVYDLQTARWTQEDPIRIAGGLNLYQSALGHVLHRRVGLRPRGGCAAGPCEVYRRGGETHRRAALQQI